MDRRQFLTTLGCGALGGALIGLQFGASKPIETNPSEHHGLYRAACWYADVPENERGKVCVVSVDRSPYPFQTFDDLKEGDVFRVLWPDGWESPMGDRIELNMPEYHQRYKVESAPVRCDTIHGPNSTVQVKRL